MTVIRDATTDDLGILFNLGSLMRSESIELYPPGDREHVKKHLDMALIAPDIFLIVIAEDAGFPIGMMTAVAGPYSFSPRIRTASDLLFVLPEYRGGLAAMKLIQRFKDWSDGIGAVNSTLSVATGISPARTGQFFELMGFRPMEKTYRRDR